MVFLDRQKVGARSLRGAAQLSEQIDFPGRYTEGSPVRLDRGSGPGSPRGALRVELREEAGACGGQLALRLEDPLRRDANVIVGLQGLLDEAAE